MTKRRQGRRRCQGEQGVTLIELLITLALMVTAFVALLAGFATVEKQIGSTGDDAQLASLARQVTGVIEAAPGAAGCVPSSTKACPALLYIECSNTTGTYAPPGQIAYATQLAYDFPAGLLGSDTIHIVSVSQPASVSGSPTPLQLSACGSGTQSSLPDYGVQQITFRVSTPRGNAVVRVVYKRWD